MEKCGRVRFSVILAVISIIGVGCGIRDGNLREKSSPARQGTAVYSSKDDLFIVYRKISKNPQIENIDKKLVSLQIQHRFWLLEKKKAEKFIKGFSKIPSKKVQTKNYRNNQRRYLYEINRQQERIIVIEKYLSTLAEQIEMLACERHYLIEKKISIGER